MLKFFASAKHLCCTVIYITPGVVCGVVLYSYLCYPCMRCCVVHLSMLPLALYAVLCCTFIYVTLALYAVLCCTFIYVTPGAVCGVVLYIYLCYPGAVCGVVLYIYLCYPWRCMRCCLSKPHKEQQFVCSLSYV